MVRKIKKKKQSSVIGFQDKEVERLKEALRPFAQLPIPGDVNHKGEPAYGCSEPSGEAVYLYIGKPDFTDNYLTLDDFKKARTVLGMTETVARNK